MPHPQDSGTKGLKEKQGRRPVKEIRIKVAILYDNTRHQALTADWGFSCLVEAHGKRIRNYSAR